MPNHSSKQYPTCPHRRSGRAGPTICAILLAMIAGCKQVPVNRLEEADRFQKQTGARVAAIQIDPTVPLSEDRCVEIALQNNLDYRVKQLQLSLQDEQVKLAMVSGLPKGEMAFSATRRSNQALTEFGNLQVEMEDRSLRSFTFQAMIPILDWGATYYAYQMAKDRRRQEELLLERTRQTLARDVRAAYARLAGLQRQERLVRVGLLAARELLRVAQSMEREGLGTRAATAEVEAGLAQAALQWSGLRRNVEQARLSLAQTMSLPPGVSFSIDDTLPPARPLPTAAQISALEDSALKSRPELHIQDLQRRISANAVHERFAHFFPRLDGLVSFNWSTESLLVNKSFFRYGAQVSHSLLNGGADLWLYQQAKKGVGVEDERALLLSLGILYEVDLRVLQLFALYDTVVAREAVVKSQQEALKQIVSRYLQGMETGMDTVRSLADMYYARWQLDQAQTEYQVAWHELNAATLPEVSHLSELLPPPGAKPLPSFEPAPALDTYEKMIESAPPIDLRQFPELEGLLKAGPKR